MQKNDLESRILILDGFDEIKTLNNRFRLLNPFFSDIRDIKKFKYIITSRPAYITDLTYFDKVFELKAFDIK